MFDSYTLKARIYPVILLFLPIAITGAFYSVEYKSFSHLFASTIIAGACIYLFSQLGRDPGKRKEPTLWESWGGMPSMQMLRWSNSHIDPLTKVRYHKTLAKLSKTIGPANLDVEMNDTIKNDLVYQAWTKYLINNTRDEKCFPLLLKENTSYGFRRNLWGIKGIALMILFALLIGNYGFHWLKVKSYNPLNFPQVFLVSSSALILIICFWLFVVTKSWIKPIAFAYADRLCEAVDQLTEVKKS